jgi:hypothetical protein
MQPGEAKTVTFRLEEEHGVQQEKLGFVVERHTLIKKIFHISRVFGRG